MAEWLEYRAAKLKVAGSNLKKLFFAFFFAQAHFFLDFFAQIRRIRQRMRQICANLQNLIRGANSTHRVLT